MRRTRKILAALFCLTSALAGHEQGARVEYVGGTIQQIPPGCQGYAQTLDEQSFIFYSRGAIWRVPYESINLLEYGQNVSRRLAAAVLISPLFILSKSRRHFLTIGYADEQGKQQALVFRVNKDDIRLVLATLEARTGRRIEFQDEEARKAGRG